MKQEALHSTIMSFLFVEMAVVVLLENFNTFSFFYSCKLIKENKPNLFGKNVCQGTWSENFPKTLSPKVAKSAVESIQKNM